MNGRTPILVVETPDQETPGEKEREVGEERGEGRERFEGRGRRDGGGGIHKLRKVSNRIFCAPNERFSKQKEALCISGKYKKLRKKHWISQKNHQRYLNYLI